MKWKSVLVAGLISCFGVPAVADECCSSDCCWTDWCSGWSLYGDWLYWSTRRCQLDYAINVDPVEGRIYGIDPCYSSGFRVGFSKSLCNIEADLGVRYTYYHQCFDNSVFNPTSALAATRIGISNAETSAGRIELACGTYDIDLDVIDLEANHDWALHYDLNLHFFGGVKLAFIDERLKVGYFENANDKGSSNPEAHADRIDAKVDTNAYGIYFGMGGDWAFWKCVKFFGNLSIATLVGDVDRKLLQEGAADDGEPFVVYIDVTDHCNRLIGNLNYAIGFETTFFRCWELAVGYEMHLWMNMSDYIVLNENNDGSEYGLDRSADTLGFEGLFIRLGVGF